MSRVSGKLPRGVFEKDPGSGVCWIRYADTGGKVRRELAGTLSNALTLYRKRKTEVLQRRKLPETLRSRAILFSAIAQDALAYSRTHKQSHEIDEVRMRFLLEWFGSTPADQITPQQIQRVLEREMQAREWKPATHNRYRALVSLVYGLAVRNGRVQSNPARLTRALREDNAVIRFLGFDEEKRLFAILRDECPERVPEVILALHTGMRCGEQYGLEWPLVSLERKVVTIRRSKHGAARYIPLDTEALRALADLKARGDIKGRVMCGLDGLPLKRPRGWFESAVSNANLDGHFTWHCLRHTFASRLVMSGVDLRTVQELMGHKTIAMTLRYAHLAPAHTLEAVNRMAEWSAQKLKNELTPQLTPAPKINPKTKGASAS